MRKVLAKRGVGNDADGKEAATDVTTARDLLSARNGTREDSDVLADLRLELNDAADALGNEHAAQLVDCNTRLAVATLHAQRLADIAAKAEEAADLPAQVDPLTLLPTRAVLLDRLGQAIGEARRHQMRLALLFIDVDDFKCLNDSWGHAFGDDVLRTIGQRLVAATRSTDTVSRHGGDEFLILLSEIAHTEDAQKIAEAINDAIAVPFSIDAQELRLTVSIGISVYPDHGDDEHTLIDRADIAMYRAKREGSGHAMFDPSTPEHDGTPASRRLSNHGSNAPAVPATAAAEPLNVQMQEANGRLVQAALGAQELHEVSVREHRQQQEFLAVMSHELRNPLASIRLASSMLKPRTRSASFKLHGIIDDEVTRMTRLVDDLLDVSRVNTGKLRLDNTLLDLVPLIVDAVHGCRSRIDSRRQRLDVQLPSGALMVFGDGTRLMQVIVNLIDNASKYTPEGGLIGMHVEAADDMAILTVSDDGIGIGVDTLPKVFEPFLQDRDASNFNGAGLGIGLTIVRELVAAHGGSVVAMSDGVGCGSCFVVTLPLTSAPGSRSPSE